MVNDVKRYADIWRLLQKERENKELQRGVSVGFYFSEVWLPMSILPREGEVVLVQNRKGRVEASVWLGDRFSNLPLFFRVTSWRRLTNKVENVILEINSAEEALEISNLISDPIKAIEEGYKRGYRNGKMDRQNC